MLRTSGLTAALGIMVLVIQFPTRLIAQDPQSRADQDQQDTTPAAPSTPEPLVPAADRSGSPFPSLLAHRMDGGTEITLDGRVEEDAWQGAIPITDFTQQEPVEGAGPSQPTEIRVVYDEDNLYIGAVIYDDPEGILAYQRQRDAGLGTDDRFMWILDTFHDGRTGYFFEINAAGLMGDGILGGGGGLNKSWDGIWEARTARRPDGWSAEIQIPFRTLNFDPAQDTWGINFQRTIRRRQEEILWRGWLRNQGLFSPVYAGDLTGLEGLSQGVGLEAVPSTIVSWKRTPDDEDPSTFPRDLSLDINYSITSSLRASLSVNTDFGRGGGGPAPGQSHPISSVLPRAEGLLPGGIGSLLLRAEERPRSILLSADRAQEPPGGAHRLRSPP